MGFLDSIKSAFAKYIIFSGRASQSEFWYFLLFLFLLGFCIGAFFSILSIIYYPSTIPRELYLLFSRFFLAVTLIPTLSINARRLHDINKSALWLLLFAPYIIFLRIPWTDIMINRGASTFVTEYLNFLVIITIIFIATYVYYFFSNIICSSMC